ncbi:MAG: ferritin, partial [Saprospiraceae bacterium]|nr:ferritin [Saprospiraceae bacterium]
YMLDMDGAAMIPEVKKPPHKFGSVQKIFEDIYKHEQKVTKAINGIVELAIQQNDHATHNFLQWYVEEQREEEALMRTILDKLKLIGKGGQSLYFIDKEMEQINLQIEKQENTSSA